jgi:hypothetical protein
MPAAPTVIVPSEDPVRSSQNMSPQIFLPTVLVTKPTVLVTHGRDRMTDEVSGGEQPPAEILRITSIDSDLRVIEILALSPFARSEVCSHLPQSYTFHVINTISAPRIEVLQW